MESLTNRGLNRLVVITGAARGIGLDTAQVLNQNGWKVVGIDMIPAEDPAVFAGFYTVDITDRKLIDETISKIVITHGSIFGLVNNAALTPVAPFLNAKDEDLDLAIEVNVKSVFRITRSVGEHMKEQGCGSIVNLASVNAERGVTNTTIYSLTKGAIEAFTRTLAVEFASHNIRSNAIAPAPTSTKKVLALLDQAAIEVRTNRIPMKRLGRPRDMANAIQFLLSDESEFITGSILPVDGGYLAYGS